MLKDMPKNTGGGDKKSNQYEESKITGTKTEPVAKIELPAITYGHGRATATPTKAEGVAKVETPSDRKWSGG